MITKLVLVVDGGQTLGIFGVSFLVGWKNNSVRGAIFNHSNQLIKQFGKIDVLINNCVNNLKVEDKGEKNYSWLENFSVEIWNHDFAVGLASVLRGKS